MPISFLSVVWSQIKEAKNEGTHPFCHVDKGTTPHTYEVFYVDSLAGVYLSAPVMGATDIGDFEGNFLSDSISVDGPEGAVVATYKQSAAAVLAVENDSKKNPLYVGRAVPGSAKSAAVWQIRKNIFDPQGSLTDIQYANGSMAFNAVWNNRASLSYS